MSPPVPVAEPACPEEAIPFALFKVKVVAVDATTVKVPLLNGLVYPITAYPFPSRPLFAPPAKVPWYTVFPPDAAEVPVIEAIAAGTAG